MTEIERLLRIAVLAEKWAAGTISAAGFAGKTRALLLGQFSAGELIRGQLDQSNPERMDRLSAVRQLCESKLGSVYDEDTQRMARDVLEVLDD